MQRKQTLVIMAALAGTTAVLGIFGAGAWYMLSHRAAAVGGDLQAAVAAEEYHPTSQWIEEGLDPDVTTFGFEGKSGVAAAHGPELSEVEIQQLVNTRQNDLMGCYASALQEDDELQGRVDFRFGIAPDGHVAMVKVTGSSLRSTPTEDCMVAKAKTWSFPPTQRASLMKFDTDFTFVYE